MREIKFRSWFENSKTMSLNFSLEDVLKHEVDYVGDCVFMQYTGLKDKNGVEIYEGDICCDYFDNAIGVIKFINGCFVYEALYDDMFDNIAEDSKRFRVPLMKRVVRENQYVEVIGNIYENKELLNE